MSTSPILPQPTSLGPSKQARQIGRALNTIVPHLLKLHASRSAYTDAADMLDTLSLFAQSYSDVVKPTIITKLKDAATEE